MTLVQPRLVRLDGIDWGSLASGVTATTRIASKSRGGPLVEVLPALSEQEAPGGDDYHLRRLVYPYPPPPKISTRTTMISISIHTLMALTSFGETQILVVLSRGLGGRLRRPLVLATSTIESFASLTGESPLGR